MQSLRTRSISAFTRIELLVTVACVLVVLALLLPGLAKSKARSSRLGCTNCLKQIGLSFRSWAIDNNDHYPMQVSVTNGGTMELVTGGLVFPHFRLMSNELSTPRILVCPNDKNRTYATNFDSDLKDTKLSYFINADAVEGDESSLLGGDRNLTNQPAAGSRLVCVSKSMPLAWTGEIHHEQGNVGFGDGAVYGFVNGSVPLTARLREGVTNRLAVPEAH
jgi:competence protein ComGC